MNIMNEGLDKNQRRAGQLGPTEKVGKNGPRGKLVGANESADGNTPSTKMFLEVDDDDELLDEADLIISPALFGKGDRSFKPKHADHEVSMARNDCFQSAVNAAKVFKMLRNVSEMQGIDGWVASKITLAADYLNTVREYLEGQQLERNSMQAVAEGFKSTYNVGDRVDGPLGTGTIVAVSKNVNVDGRVKVKLDDPSKAGEDGKYKDSFVFTTTQLKHISEQAMAEGTNKRIKGGDPCRDKYKMVGMKQKGGRPVPNCVPSNPPKKKKK